MSNEIIRATNLSIRDADTTILYPTDLVVNEGLTIVTGPSGSGKSTLVNALFGLIKPSTGLVVHMNSSGSVVYRNAAPTEERETFPCRLMGKLMLESRARRREADYRSRNLGYIAQEPYIPPSLTAEDYIRLVHDARGNRVDSRYLSAVYDYLDIAGHVGKITNKLSGGEKQRVSIASALAHEPRLVVADEPTSALDTANKVGAMSLFRGVVDEGYTSVLMVSHDPEALEYADTIIRMQDGLVNEMVNC